jgi:uncharacterized protein (TIGR03437 family)
MHRPILALALMASWGAHAATTNTTLTVTASGPLGLSVTATGTAALSGIGSGTFSAAVDLSALTAPFTITLTNGTTGTLTGKLTIPATLLTTGTGNGSATITGGTGNFAGATGTFPTLTGSGALNASNGTVTLTFTGDGSITTSGGGNPAPTGPEITAVWDSASNTSNLAQGSIFIVKGSKLCPSGIQVFSVPRPTVSPNGVKITFTPVGGGTATDAFLVYTYNPSGTCQLAGILPSSVAVGNYNVVVTNGTASAPFATKVQQRKFALFTQDSSGTGLGSVQNYISASQVDLNSFTTGSGKATTISPAKPGQYLIAWGTGLGPLVGGDNAASPVFDYSTNGVNVKAIVGGVTIPVLFAGRAGYAGEDQINFQLPNNVPTGCTVPFQLSVDGKLSNTTFIAIAPDANAAACVQPGFTTAQLQQYDGGATRTLGSFSLSQFSVNIPEFGVGKLNTAGGAFTRYTGYQLDGLSRAQAEVTSSGACIVAHTQSSDEPGLTPAASGGLDAGVVTLSGPTGSGLSNQVLTQDAVGLDYYLNLGGSGFPTTGLNANLVAGTYSLAGAGGRDVGKFNTQITLGSPLSLVNSLPATVDRSAGLTLRWTGGNASDLVQILGSSSTTSGTGGSAITDSWSFVCSTNAGAGSFTVPASVLLQLPAVSSSSTSGSGFLEIASAVNPASFTAPLTAGGSIDSGTFLSLIGFGASVSYQ